MARVTLQHAWGARTLQFTVETTYIVRNADEFHEALSGALPAVKTEDLRELKERLWETFLEHYDIVQAVYDEDTPSWEADSQVEEGENDSVTDARPAD